jgi:hypothetical protein
VTVFLILLALRELAVQEGRQEPKQMITEDELALWWSHSQPGTQGGLPMNDDLLRGTLKLRDEYRKLGREVWWTGSSGVPTKCEALSSSPSTAKKKKKKEKKTGNSIFQLKGRRRTKLLL